MRRAHERRYHPGAKLLVNGSANRVLKLRGCGDVIVAPLDIALIESYMGVVGEAH